jgi:hypothetical protein
MKSEELHRLYKHSELVTYMRVNRLKLDGNIVRIIEKKIENGFYMGVLEGEVYEVGKDAAKLLKKKNCRVTAKHMSDTRKQKGGHGSETGR